MIHTQLARVFAGRRSAGCVREHHSCVRPEVFFCCLSSTFCALHTKPARTLSPPSQTLRQPTHDPEHPQACDTRHTHTHTHFPQHTHTRAIAQNQPRHRPKEVRAARAAPFNITASPSRILRAARRAHAARAQGATRRPSARISSTPLFCCFSPRARAARTPILPLTPRFSPLAARAALHAVPTVLARLPITVARAAMATNGVDTATGPNVYTFIKGQSKGDKTMKALVRVRVCCVLVAGRARYARRRPPLTPTTHPKKTNPQHIPARRQGRQPVRDGQGRRQRAARHDDHDGRV